MSMNRPHVKKITCAEYLTWPEEPRYEIIDGIPYLQAAHHAYINGLSPSSQENYMPY
ncbi:hypothetical protein [Shouchella shacheensis]|uniref:hypothetical protein n=1 Tax=Shouchella shacheensis TaxID=1649580 RepID=UPI000A492AD0|nr:hypothetical protein [Shouchella shacheensis]